MGAGCSRRDKGPGVVPEGGCGVGELVGKGKSLHLTQSFHSKGSKLTDT